MPQTLIDLTLTFSDGKRGISFVPELTLADDGFNTTTLQIYSHALTHMDAPKHFLMGREGIEFIDLNKCIGKAVVIDLSHKEPNSLIVVDDILPHADYVQSGARVLLRTDWDAHSNDEDYRDCFPRISPELAQWFVDKQIALLGVETPSVASLSEENYPELQAVHQTLLDADVVIVESLCNLKLLPPVVTFIAFPLKLENCDGSPVRAVALIPDEEKSA
ncbi:MAG: cyclase family protein [Chloroflexota bacterium]